MGRSRVVVIGAGNVATHLAKAIDGVADVVEVCARTMESSARLSGKLRASTPLDDVAEITPDADFYLISVNDDAIAGVAEAMPDIGGVVMHTSGSVDIGVLSRFPRRGVFYPLQTFSREADVNVSSVPVFIEASDENTLSQIDAFARKITSTVNHADSHDRCVLHIAAVFACNFCNNLWARADRILNANGYSLDVLKPLLEVTLEKALTHNPEKVQTGPAARGDIKVMDRHQMMLSGIDLEIYRLLSSSIMQTQGITQH